MLRGKNVVLRAVEREDLKLIHALERNVELTMLGNGEWEPIPLAALEKQWEKRLEDDDDRSDFVIEVAGKVIGDIGLFRRNRRHGTAQLGICIGDPEYVGKGYGREALNLLLDWAFRIQNWRKITLDVFEVNERAIRMYRACGFREEGRLKQHFFFDGGYVDLVIMSLLRSEWEALHAGGGAE